MVFIKKMINNGCTQIYGSSIDLTGKNVSITPDGFFVDGKPIVEFDESETPVLKIEITGNVESLTTEEGEITVNGHVGTVVSKDGDIKCRTVGGNVENKDGDIYCGKVMGNCYTKNGDIYCNK